MFLLKLIRIQTNKFLSAIEIFYSLCRNPLSKLWNFLSFWGSYDKGFYGSNLQDTILPSETDLKAIKATDSFIPPTDFNIDNLLIDELKLDIAVSSKSKTSSISKTSNDRSSISWKFVINIKDEDNDDK